MTEEFNESMIKEVKEGDKVTGEVQQIEDKHVVVHVDGSKFNGIIPISQLSTHHIEHASEIVNVGDKVEAYVIKVELDEENESGNLVLSKRQVEKEQSYDDLKEKLENNETIEAKVTEVVKGGLVVDVGQRGFVPASLISTEFIEDFSDYEGKVLSLKVEELDPENNRVILSHKAIEELENNKKKDALLDSIQAGDVLEGKVARIANFGAFIDIGGVDGLVHVSELTHQHVKSPEDVLNIGDNVKVKVKSVDKEAERISLSIKDTLPSPFETLQSQFKEGDVVAGKVVRLAQFGAFVEIAAGVQGLVHVSEISHQHVANPSDVLEPGQEVEVKILGINVDDERVSLSIKATKPNDSVEESDKATTQAYLQQSQDEEDTPTLGDVFGDKLKNLKL